MVESEATEDIHKGMSIGQLEGGVSRVPLWSLYRKRVTWLVLLVFGNLFSGAGIAHFEDTIAAQVTLVFFLPLLIGSGGNAGAQAATLMVRGMATGDVGIKDWGKLLGRELLVAGSLGLTMALAVAPIGVMRGGEAVAMVVAISMICIVLFEDATASFHELSEHELFPAVRDDAVSFPNPLDELGSAVDIDGVSPSEQSLGFVQLLQEQQDPRRALLGPLWPVFEGVAPQRSLQCLHHFL